MSATGQFLLAIDSRSPGRDIAIHNTAEWAHWMSDSQCTIEPQHPGATTADEARAKSSFIGETVLGSTIPPVTSPAGCRGSVTTAASERKNQVVSLE